MFQTSNGEYKPTCVEDMSNKDYSESDPELVERVRSAEDDELAGYLENAKRHLPQTQWLVDVIAQEQLKRGGTQTLTPDSVREVILKHAREGRTCTYKLIAESLGISWSEAHWRLPGVLGKVSEMESGIGRPLLTAIVTSQKGSCGDGFFQMARQNGYGYKFRDRLEFQRQEQQRVFEYWKDH
jgi:hypothetical protein